MLSKPISAKVIFALALAILMAWAGHASALFVGASPPTWSDNQHVHAHSHGDGAFACAVCADHYHSPLTADHVHETPHLSTGLSIASQPECTLLLESPGYSIPASPIYLIERPPRPGLMF